MEYSAAMTKHQGSSMDWCGLMEHVGKWGEKKQNAKEDLEYATSYEEEEQIRNNSFDGAPGWLSS